MNDDPPDFSETCALLFQIRVGKKFFNVDIPAIDAWIAAQSLPAETVAMLSAARSEITSAFRQNDMELTHKRILEWFKDVRMLHREALANKGAKLNGGREKGALGPVAKKVKTYLSKRPAASPIEVWNALRQAPPKNHVFMESPKLGKYIEKGAHTVMEWPRFRNIVSEHRPKK
ncbi:hypothetical protein BH11PSE11_BH11PSE11_12340 [soil metagenome]